MAKQLNGDELAKAFSKTVFDHSQLSGKAICAKFLRQLGVSKDWARVTLREMQCMLRDFPDAKLFEAARNLERPLEDDVLETLLREWLKDPEMRERLFAILIAQVNPNDRDRTMRDLRDITDNHACEQVKHKPRKTNPRCPRCACVADMNK